MSADPFVEIRGEILREHVDVIDAVVQATPGASRMSILRGIVADWVARETHRASLVMRVTGGNGSGTEPDWNRSGGAPR